MSAPTRQLGKLSIGEDMPTTRSQAQRQGETAPHRADPPSDSGSDEEEEEESDEESTTSSLVRGRSTIAYDLRQLAPASKHRAIAGLRGEFTVDKCRAIHDGFDFQVADHGRVHVGQGLTCTCRDFGTTSEACRHIFWLVDQLHRWALPGPPSPGVPLSSSGESSRFPPMLDLVGDKMEAIAKKVKWPYDRGSGSPVDSGTEAPAAMTRPDKARDILSSFSKTTMPDEFRTDLVETISQPRTPEECVVQGDLEATMFRLAVHDQDVYAGLRKVMPAGARAAIFFDKIQQRSSALLADFDLYRQTGAPRHDGRPLEIPLVVAELRDNIQQVQKNIYARSPYKSKGATEALIELLGDIANRNYDAFGNSNWGRHPPSGETEEDRNLYVQLIGNADDYFFVIDCLESLPESTLSQWEPQLEAVFDTIQSNGAPLPYLRKLKILVTGERSGTSSVAAAGPSGQKRPATAGGPSGGGRKRTK